MPVAAVTDDDPVESRLRFDDDEDERRRVRRGPRSRDEQDEREREEDTARERLEKERRDRAAGIDRRLERIEAQVSQILPGVGDIVNGKIKGLRDDVDKLKDVEGGNRVVRAWFFAMLATVGGACVVAIVLWTTGTLHHVAQFFSVSTAPVNPQPSVLFREAPTPEPAGVRCQRIALELGLPEQDMRDVVSRCFTLKPKEEHRGR